MISILIVEDDPVKLKSIKSAILELPDFAQKDIKVAIDKNTAREFLMEEQFDLVILDVTLSERFGDELEEDGGIKLLEEMNVADDFNLPFHIIGITAYPDRKEKFMKRFSDLLWHLIVYNEQYNEWKFQLINYIRYLVKSQTELRNPIAHLLTHSLLAYPAAEGDPAYPVNIKMVKLPNVNLA